LPVAILNCGVPDLLDKYFGKFFYLWCRHITYFPHVIL
jgi:hypothetical protein